MDRSEHLRELLEYYRASAEHLSSVEFDRFAGLVGHMKGFIEFYDTCIEVNNRLRLIEKELEGTHERV